MYNIIRLTWKRAKVEDYTTHNFLELHKNVDHARILNRILYVSGIIHTILGVAVLWSVKIHIYVTSYSTNGKIHCMCKYLKKTEAIS